jgi:hypothetical protein
MTRRKTITTLAKRVAREIADGRPGDQSLSASQALQAEPDAALDLIELCLAEAARKRPSELLLSAYAFLLGRTLEALRYGIEAGHGGAAAVAEAVRHRLVAAGRGGEAEPPLLLLLLAAFGTAKLDPGPDLRALVSELLEADPGPAAGGPEPGPIDVAGYVGELVEAAGGSPFVLFAEMQETGEAFPDEHRAAMATMLLHAGEPVGREAAIGWLLDPSAAVRERVARELEEAAAHGLVSGTMLRRMIAMRNWVPEAARPALDRAIQACRRHGCACAPWPQVELREVRVAGVDGSGAIAALAQSREGRRTGLASVLMKQELGIRDAWAQHGMTRREIDETLLQVAGLDQVVADAEFLGTALGHFLAISLERALPVPFGLVDAVEAAGLPSVQPSAVATEALLATIRRTAGPAELEGAALERLLAAGRDLPDECAFMESWFEDGDQVRALLGGRRLSRAAREALVMEQLLEARRGRWADLLAWTAFLLSRSRRQERWPELYAAAQALVEGRPVAEIPVMRHVAAQTVAFAGR